MSEEPSFCLDLKVRDEVHQLSICLGDSKQTLLSKLEKIYPNCVSKPQESLEKIKSHLQAVCRSAEVQQDLKEIVEFFYNKNFNESGDLETEFQISDIPMQSRAKTCFQGPITPVKSSKSMAIQTEFSPEKKSIQDSKVLSMNNLIPKSIELPKHKRYENRSQKDNQENVVLVKQKPKQVKKKNIGNPDLIKACEMILKKNTIQSDLKEMAKSYLKEKGVFKEEKQMKKLRKKAVKTEISQPQSNINPEKSYQRSQFKPIQRFPISRDSYSISKQPRSHIKSEHILNRYQYLNCSVENLKNCYEEKRPITETSNSQTGTQKKYRYLDD